MTHEHKANEEENTMSIQHYIDEGVFTNHRHHTTSRLHLNED